MLGGTRAILVLTFLGLAAPGAIAPGVDLEDPVLSWRDDPYDVIAHDSITFSAMPEGYCTAPEVDILEASASVADNDIIVTARFMSRTFSATPVQCHGEVAPHLGEESYEIEVVGNDTVSIFVWLWRNAEGLDTCVSARIAFDFGPDCDHGEIAIDGDTIRARIPTSGVVDLGDDQLVPYTLAGDRQLETWAYVWVADPTFAEAGLSYRIEDRHDSPYFIVPS